MPGGDKRPHLGGLVHRVAHLHGRHVARQQIQETVHCRAFDQDAGAGAAILAGVTEHGARRRGGGPLEVGVGEHDVGRFAAQLEGYPLDGL